MTKISLCIITKNEEENLKKWKNWVKKLKNIDEIIAIDDNSTDSTKKILKEIGAKIFSRNLCNDFSAQRNFAISKAKNNWILFLDADEEPSEKLIHWLNSFNFQKNAYAFKRNIIYQDQIITHGQAENDYPIRLFTKDLGKFVRPVHETFKLQSCPIFIANHINHYSAPNLSVFLSKINQYSSLRAQELFENKIKCNIFSIVFYPIAKFFDIYFLKLGFLDKLPGLIISISLSFNSFLIRSKLWRLYHA